MAGKLTRIWEFEIGSVEWGGVMWQGTTTRLCGAQEQEEEGAIRLDDSGERKRVNFMIRVSSFVVRRLFYKRPFAASSAVELLDRAT